MRDLAVTTILRLLRVTLRVLSRVVPQSHSIVVSSHPETEGNGLEITRALLERYDGRVIWLRESGEPPAELQGWLSLSKPKAVRRSGSSPHRWLSLSKPKNRKGRAVRRPRWSAASEASDQSRPRPYAARKPQPTAG